MRFACGLFFLPSRLAAPASVVLTFPLVRAYAWRDVVKALGALLCCVGLLGAMSCTGAAPAGEPEPVEARDATSPTSRDVTQRFAGTWRLVRVGRLDADDRPSPEPPAFGAPNAVGFSMYDPAGFMGVVIMQDARAPYADTRPTADEARMALSRYTAYFGTYTIDEAERVITHHVEGNLSPNGTGVDNRRAYEVVDDTLILMPSRGSSGIRLRIIWRRKVTSRS